MAAVARLLMREQASRLHVSRYERTRVWPGAWGACGINHGGHLGTCSSATSRMPWPPSHVGHAPRARLLLMHLHDAVVALLPAVAFAVEDHDLHAHAHIISSISADTTASTSKFE